jgi:hypothetical protein
MATTNTAASHAETTYAITVDPNDKTALPTSLTSALDRFWDHNGGQYPHYVVAQMKGLHRAERKRKLGWRM